ncbi:helix-turn-helix domain-containing protein [Streptomyces sp. NPDC055089]
MSAESHFTIGFHAVASVVLPLRAGAHVTTHNHPQHQLVWAPSGLLTMEVGSFRWVVQRSRALWIPSDVDHAVFPNSAVDMVSLYFEPEDCPLRWDVPTVVDATGLVGPLLTHLAHIGADAEDHRARVTAVLWDLMRPLSVATIPTILPTDPLALEIALAIKQNPADPRELKDWGQKVGASPRTLSRRFRAETGVSFGNWRTYERLNAALPMLGMGRPISRVARAVGYTTASAFITAFRREIGTTPAAYFSGNGARPDLTWTKAPAAGD